MFAKIGDFHEGEYKQNLREGPGKYFWKDGRQFIGNYHNDERSGEGKFIYPNGDMYVGNFENGSRSGYGVFTFSQKTCEYRGDWRNSTYNGSGRLKWVADDGIHVYEGEFRDGMFHGKGKEMVGDQLKRQGWWMKGSYNGEEDPAGTNHKSDESSDHAERKAENANDQPTKATIEESPSKDECPTTLEQNYSDVRLQWKRSLEPASA